MMQPLVSRLGVGLFALVMLVWMYFGFALDLQRRAATPPHPPVAHAMDSVRVALSVEDMIRMPARQQISAPQVLGDGYCLSSFVRVPPSVEDMIGLPAQAPSSHHPSIEDLANLPALAQGISIPSVVDELGALPRGRGPVSRSIIQRPTPTPTRRVSEHDRLRDIEGENLVGPRERRRVVDLGDSLRGLTPTPTPTPTRLR